MASRKDDVLGRVPLSRRAFVKRLLVGSFAIPIVSSFALSALGSRAAAGEWDGFRNPGGNYPGWYKHGGYYPGGREEDPHERGRGKGKRRGRRERRDDD